MPSHEQGRADIAQFSAEQPTPDRAQQHGACRLLSAQCDFRCESQRRQARPVTPQVISHRVRERVAAESRVAAVAREHCADFAFNRQSMIERTAHHVRQQRLRLSCWALAHQIGKVDLGRKDRALKMLEAAVFSREPRPCWLCRN